MQAPQVHEGQVAPVVHVPVEIDVGGPHPEMQARLVQGPQARALKAHAHNQAQQSEVHVHCMAPIFSRKAALFIRTLNTARARPAMWLDILASAGTHLPRGAESRGSRAASHAAGMPSSPVERATMPPTMAQVVSRSPRPATVVQSASS